MDNEIILCYRPVFRNRQVCLLVDSEEPLRERFVRVALQRGLSAKTRKLPVGDFLWVLLPPGVNPDTVRDMPEQELVGRNVLFYPLKLQAQSSKLSFYRTSIISFNGQIYTRDKLSV